MDQIFLSILSSTKPEAQKHVVIKKILGAGSQTNSVETVKKIFQTAIYIMLNFEDELSIISSKDVYIAWAKSNRATLAEYLSVNEVSNLLVNKARNPENISYILLHSFKMLSGSYPDRLPPLESVVEQNAVHFVDHNSSHISLIPFCSFLLEFKRCIPQRNNTAKFCIAVLQAVTYFDIATVVNPKKFIAKMNNFIGGLMGHIWMRCDPDTVGISLKTVFDIIQSVENGVEKAPSVALAAIVQYIPSDYIEGATKSVTSNPHIPDENIELALERMMMWIQWPAANNIELWIIAFLKGLAFGHRYTILINVTEQSIEKIFTSLQFRQNRKCAFIVLSHLLLSFQHSAEAFHRISSKFPALVNAVKRELYEQESSEDKDFLIQLSELLHCLMHLHPGFPDIYEPIINSIKGLPVPSIETIQKRITQSRWGSNNTQGERVSSISKWLRKSETGKIGLLNLGNTCYMNSVVQILFMCDTFRQDVLKSAPGSTQLILVKLQHVFAFLSASNRAFFTPKKFLEASRPSWFVNRHQQDCSEFLRYLLDLLHEEEKKSFQLLQNYPAEKKHTNNKEKLKNKVTATTSLNGSEQSLVEQTFGGKLINTYLCLNCKAKSSHSERFNDIALPFPELSVNDDGKTASGNNSKSLKNASNSTKKSKTGKSEKEGKSLLLLEDLLTKYLEPEILEGDNQYHCDRCKSLQDAQRTVQITNSPEYLFITLLRFSFDIKTQHKSKILTDVRYPKTLYVPINTCKSHMSPKANPRATTVKSMESTEVYALCGVIVHSGLSSDDGHYYCYARHNFMLNKQHSVPQAADVDFLQDKWYLFNDSRVTYSTYSSFSDITQTFAKDTAYVLVYRKVREGITMVDPNESIQTEVVDTPLRRDLREAVDKDNREYILEQEKEQKRQATKRHQISEWFWKGDNDDQGPPGNCGGGGFGLHQGPNFVF